MNAGCPLCGEEIREDQPTIKTEHEGAEVTAHRSHFEDDTSPETTEDATKDESPSEPIEVESPNHKK